MRSSNYLGRCVPLYIHAPAHPAHTVNARSVFLIPLLCRAVLLFFSYDFIVLHFSFFLLVWCKHLTFPLASNIFYIILFLLFIKFTESETFFFFNDFWKNSKIAFEWSSATSAIHNMSYNSWIRNKRFASFLLRR